MNAPTRWTGLIAMALGMVALTGRTAGAEVLIHDYELNNTLNDQLGGPALVSAGGALSAAGYSFAPNQGLSLSGALPNAANYTVDLSFSLQDLSGFRKIVDFQNLTSDQGLYNLDSALNFFNFQTSPTTDFASNTLVRVDLTRDSATNLVTGYVNGVSKISFTDSGSAAVFSATNNIINLFIDDNVTNQREASAGFVNQVRIYDGPLTAAEVAALGGPKPGQPSGSVPEPSTLVLTGLGAMIVLGTRRWSRRPTPARAG